ncbi:MAG: bifunctional phosphopantothenoylcysteine decarboxylase/phosphopantothenate--cysteine ligase CoaBC [Acidimicrobiia bacterium]|nr:bifunctional phosphopantothenoylcysteine decarboxylase/phosphopantothenate--cysteine ligase CoaBC [Acidimicrobiia bacterium]
MPLDGRRVLLTVSGGVAAYKAAYLARRLVEAGAEVRTIMTRSAERFIGAQTLAAITGTPPATDLFGGASVSPHTELARWADVIVVAPATAATMSRLATGLSEDLLSATVLAATVPVVVAPAMHTEMWEHPATQRTVVTLRADGHTIVGPASGALAGGDDGPGRLVEPEEILDAVIRVLSPGDLSGVRALVSAGGTREAIDPVRYIGNRSSGKMGNAIALAAAARGAKVVLVTTAPAPEHGGIDVVSVESAREMAEAVWSRTATTDVAVLAAAVADFAPADPAGSKLRRADGPPEIRLEPTPDILAGVADADPRPFLVGFAAETGRAEGAVDKAKEKGVDLLVANDVTDAASGFGTDTNRVSLIDADGSVESWELLTKREVADRLWDRIVERRGGSR